MSKFVKLLWESLAIWSITSIFEDDSYSIISKKGQIKLKEYE